MRAWNIGWLGALVGLICYVSITWADVQGTTNVPLADVTVTGTATLIRAANSQRAALSCTNHSTSVHVRWADSTVTTTAGQRFSADRTISIQSRGPIYMISEGANVTVSCTEELR